jgi:endonuclease/exonuclease/phosphatase family metal-dependent hydrolase
MITIATWNMQGATKVPDINTVAQSTSANVICLQECGLLPEHLKDTVPLTGGDGSTIGCTGKFIVGHDFMECVYWENAWAQGSLAVLSNITVKAYGIMAPATPSGYTPTKPRSMPWMTVEDPRTQAPITIYSIHSPAVFGAVTVRDTCEWNNAQIAQIAALGGTWACVGDFNADPTALNFQGPPAGHIKRGTQATQQSGGILDYAITNDDDHFVYQQQTTVVSSADHFPQVFVWP